MQITCTEGCLAQIDRCIGKINSDNGMTLTRLQGCLNRSPDGTIVIGDRLYHGYAFFAEPDDPNVEQFSLSEILHESYDGVAPESIGFAPRNIQRHAIVLTKEQLRQVNEHRGELCKEHNQILCRVVGRMVIKGPNAGRYGGHLELCDANPNYSAKRFSLNELLNTVTPPVIPDVEPETEESDEE